MTTVADIDRAIDRLLRAVAANRRAPPDRFNMYRIDPDCGSAGCFVGWARAEMGWGELRGMYDIIAVPTPGVRLWPESGSAYIWAPLSRGRSSETDDAPFAPTPEEVAVLGEQYANGLAEREAAINRALIVVACLRRWRAALVAQQEPAREVAAHA